MMLYSCWTLKNYTIAFNFAKVSSSHDRMSIGLGIQLCITLVMIMIYDDKEKLEQLSCCMNNNEGTSSFCCYRCIACNLVCVQFK